VGKLDADVEDFWCYTEGEKVVLLNLRQSSFTLNGDEKAPALEWKVPAVSDSMRVWTIVLVQRECPLGWEG
jgi:hypothetical protein